MVLTITWMEPFANLGQNICNRHTEHFSEEKNKQRIDAIDNGNVTHLSIMIICPSLL